MHAPLHCARYFMGLDEPETQTTAAEREVLARFVEGRRNAVEIGVFEGYTTRFLAERMASAARLYAIDPFTPGRLGICWGEVIAKAQARRATGARIVFVKALSFDAASQVEAPVDFIFFDGDHSREGIHRDWQLWSELVAVDGVCALHDTAVPDWDPGRAHHGSVGYFADTISRDPRFVSVARVDSLNVVKRIA